MTPLTAEKIAELERLLAAATAGPYEALFSLSGKIADIRSDNDGEVVAFGLRPNDASLIVAIHEALPYFLSLAKRVAGAPVGTLNVDAMHDHRGIHLRDANPMVLTLQGKRVALVEIVGGEEG